MNRLNHRTMAGRFSTMLSQRQGGEFGTDGEIWLLSGGMNAIHDCRAKKLARPQVELTNRRVTEYFWPVAIDGTDAHGAVAARGERINDLANNLEDAITYAPQGIHHDFYKKLDGGRSSD